MHTPSPSPKLLSILPYNKPFWSYSPIFGKVYWMTPNDLDMFKIKNTNMHVDTPPRPKFLPVSLDEPFLSYGPIFGKVHQMTPKITLICSRSKIRTCIYIHPWGPNFCLFYSTVSCYWVTDQFSEKCTKWPQMTLKGTHMHTPNIPEAQIFNPFTIWWAVCEEIKIFELPIGYNVKIKSLINLNELKISKFQKEHFMGTTARSQ